MIRMIGIPESDIAKTLRAFDADEGLGDLEITTCLRKGEMEILVSHHPEERAKRELLIEAFKKEYGGAIFSEDGETIDQQIARLLGGRTLAFAESCTGGQLAKRITDSPGVSSFFLGSAVTYSNEAKTRILGVEPGLIEEFGAVSAEVAKAMAEGAREQYGADFSVAVTGVAGPDGGTEEKPVGFVCFHAAGPAGLERDLQFTLPGRRADIQDRSVTVALHVLRSLLVD
jgi:nicotinamide-nucleotide amidase